MFLIVFVLTMSLSYNLSILDFKFTTFSNNRITKRLIIYPYWILNIENYNMTETETGL